METETIEPTEDFKVIDASDLNSRNENKKVKMKGMVYTISDIFNEIYADVYRCSNCGEEFKTLHNQNIRRCELCNCQDGLSKKKELQRDFIEMELEEMPDEVTGQPGKIKVKIYNPLIYTEDVKHLEPGEIITIKGLIKKDKIKTRNSREINEFFFLLEEIELENKRDVNEDISTEDVEKIQEIAKDNPLEKLANSLAPNIYDMIEIKKSVILQMVRGMENSETIRPRIHMLLLGEPGLAKSQISKQAHKILKRSIYGSGENMSKAGLVASMLKDEIRGGWVARAGIISRANKTILILDEFDKLSKEDMAGLHSPMESGESSVTKAGTHLTLKADCSVLASCNPKNGIFLDMSGYESVASQVNIPIPILNRFDLIFMIRDIVEENKDRKVVRSMIKSEAKRDIDIDLFRKYVTFASNIEPKIPDEIGQAIEEIYIKIRKVSKTSNETKVNPRLFRSLVSLSVACAKIRLSNEVSLEDLKEAEHLMMASFKSLGFGGSLNSIDMASLYSNTSTKKLQVESKIRELIKIKVVEHNKNNTKADWEYLKVEILDLGYAEKEIDKVFNILKKEGTLRGEDYKLIWS